MSYTIPTIPAGAPEPAKAYPKPSPAAQSPGGERHHAAALPAATTLSSADVSYVKSLMGVVPAQRMEEILLKTGVPIPANLGPNLDTMA